MVTYTRLLNLKQEVQKKSIILFGPRQTGKSFLLKKIFPDAPYYNLLYADLFLRLNQRPSLIREEMNSLSIKPSLVIIDEIQKLPSLLDEVHALIEELGIHFILTGSSARKLKRGGANLLAGRAKVRYLHPLVYPEIPNIDLNRVLQYGAIPMVYNSDDPWDDLGSYVGTYLQEEIVAEGLSRKIENFSRFLQTAALYNSELVNFSNIGSDAGVPSRTVVEYFKILEDTLIGYILPPFSKTKKRKAIMTAKFYFFDVGVCNRLAGYKHIAPKTELYGKVFEHYIFTELKAYSSYKARDLELTFWRSKSGFEVDFILNDEVAIEVKSTEFVTDKHLTGLKAIAEEISFKKLIVVSNDTRARKLGNIDILPVKDFLAHLWDGTII